MPDKQIIAIATAGWWPEAKLLTDIGHFNLMRKISRQDHTKGQGSLRAIFDTISKVKCVSEKMSAGAPI